MSNAPNNVNLGRAVVPASALIGLIVFLGGLYSFGTGYVDSAMLNKAAYFQTIADEHARRIRQLEQKDRELERVLNQLTTDMAVVRQAVKDIKEIVSSH